MRLWPLRDYADDAYRRVDDRPYGGGPGMVMLVEPLLRALDAITADRGEANPAVVHFTPTGRRIDQALVQAFAAQHDGRPGGRVVLMTSGQGLGPMPGEVAYAASKAALAGVTVTLADQLADVGITVNTVNPGPVDTGYMTPEIMARGAPVCPFGRMGKPDDPARLVEWLVSDEGRWVTGQVLNTEGGFARWRPPADGRPPEA